MHNDKQKALEITLVELLTKLNNGDKISLDDIELNYKQIQPFIERLDAIDGFPFDMNNDHIYSFKERERKTFDKYQIQDIATTILEYNTNEGYESDIQDIIKESKLPRRYDKKYKIISSYEPYELTHCISYEMAIRNKEVQALLKNIKFLTIISEQLFKANMFPDDTKIQDAAKTTIKEVSKHLNSLQISLDVNFNNFELIQAHNAIMKVISDFTVLLEEEYYMIYDQEELASKGMEDIFKEPNHYESDTELNQFMNKTIEQSLLVFSNDPNYKDNYSIEDGYVVYQGGYDESTSYDINKIFPNFKRPMREFNQTQVAFNMSLPKDEIVAYIKKIKNDYDNKHTSYKTLNQLLYGDDTRANDTLDHKQKERYADDFFIYDYYVQSDEEHEKKLEFMQKKLSQYHGMKVEISQNKYESIGYDEAKMKINHPKTNTNSNSFSDIARSFREHEHIIHYLETIKIIEDRYKTLKNAIDDKKYKTLIYYK